MNQAMLDNLSASELERHLYMTQPYSPAHLSVIATCDALEAFADAKADASDADQAYRAEKELRIDAEDALAVVEVELGKANDENQSIAAELTRQGDRVLKLEGEARTLRNIATNLLVEIDDTDMALRTLPARHVLARWCVFTTSGPVARLRNQLKDILFTQPQ